MSKIRISIFYFILFGLSFYSYSQKTNLNNEVKLFNKSKNLFLNKNYEIALIQFEAFKGKYSNSLLFSEAEFYSYMCQIYTHKINDLNKLENFISKNLDSNNRLLSAAYGEYLFDKELFNKSVKYLVLSKSNSYDVLYKIGYSYYILEDEIKAENYLKKTRSSNYKDHSNYYLGIISMKRNKYSLAVNYFNSVKIFQYEDAIKYYLLSLYYNLNELDNIIELSKVIDENTLNINHTYYIIGSTYFILKEYNKTLEYYKKYKRTDENINKINFEIGYSYYKIEEIDSALNILKDNALSDNYYGQLSSYYLGEIYLNKQNYNFASNSFYSAYLNNFDKDYSIDALFQYSKINFKIKNYEESLSSLILIKNDFPDYKTDEINYLISINYLRTSNYKRAIKFIDSLDSIGDGIKENYQKVTFQKGAELFNLGDFDQSILFFKKSLKYNINSSIYLESLFWIGESFFVQKKYKDAYSYYIKLLNCNCEIDYKLKLNTIYSLAYTLHNNKEYEKSKNYFRSYINLGNNDNEKNKLLDAQIRLADSHYATKNYDESIKIYKKLINSKVDNNYINYQIGLAYYGKNDQEKSINYFNKVIENDSSTLVDDAIYRIGSFYFEKSNFEESISFFSKIINNYKNSEYITHSYLRRATCYFNLKSYEQSENDYVFLLNNFKSQYIYNESLLGIQKVVSFTKNFTLLNNYLEKYKNLYPKDETIESIEFETIKNLYFTQNYDEIVSLSENFISTYNESVYINEVTYYLGESNYRLKKYKEGITNFHYLIKINDNKYFTRSINRLAKINFELQLYNESLNFYRLLKNNAKNNRELTDAFLGILSNHYNTKSYDSAIFYGKNLLKLEKISFNIRNKANLLIGKSYLDKNEINDGVDYLLSTINLAKDVSGAEAQYLLANLFYEQNQLNQALETLYLLNENFPEFNYWRNKSYLLIAKIFIKSEEIFQAKATLESLIDKTSNKEIKEEAEGILNELDLK